MPLDGVEDAESLVPRGGVVVASQVPQAVVAVLVDQGAQCLRDGWGKGLHERNCTAARRRSLPESTTDGGHGGAVSERPVPGRPQPVVASRKPR